MTEKTKEVPWWKKAVIYQIYPRSFMDANGDGIGDIKGIISKLDYLNDGTERSLGIDAIWISPIYKSPMKDFGYDIVDYQAIDPIFGNMEDFQLLLEEAHKRNIKVMMDLVVNHTSDEHPWFIESRSNKNNSKRDWYLWHEYSGKKINNWVAAFEMKNAWWLDEKTSECYLGTFTRHQPELNWRNVDMREEIYRMIRFWYELGIDGFRMDVVNWFIKDEQFRSNPWRFSIYPPDFQKHIYDRNRPETHDICKEMRKITDEYDDKMLVGEIYTYDPEEAVSYQGDGEDELHMAFNFDFLFSKWDAKDFYSRIIKYYGVLPKGGWPNFTLSNHDQPRHYYRYRAGKDSDARAKVAITMLMTLRGTPFIYYGEEIGMTCENISRKELQDPFGIKVWPLMKSRDVERTPMQWNDKENGGFTKAAPWLRVNSDYREKNIDRQLCDEGSLLNYYKSLIWLRKRRNSLSLGDIEFIDERPENMLVYKRNFDGEQIWVIMNFSGKHQSFEFTFDGEWKVILGTHRKQEEIKGRNLEVAPYECMLLEEDLLK